MLRALQTTTVAVPAMGAEVQTTYVTNAEEGSSTLRGEPCSGQSWHACYARVLRRQVTLYGRATSMAEAWPGLA